MLKPMPSFIITLFYIMTILWGVEFPHQQNPKLWYEALLSYYLLEAHGNKTLVVLQGARRASTPSPEGEEYEPFRANSWVEVDS